MNNNLIEGPFGADSSAQEWLETNGLGGWASSTITGCNTRRYHGLLIAATKPPTQRVALISKLDETIICGGQRFELGTNDYGDVIYPTGFQYLKSFSKDLFPEWTYQVNDITIRKKITMVHGENTTIIKYKILHAPSPFGFELLPLISARSYHALQHNSTNIWWDITFHDGIFKNQPDANNPAVYISVPGATYEHHPCWYNKFNYSVERYRGQDFEEDLFNHGKFSLQLKEGDDLYILLSTMNPINRSAVELFGKEESRKRALLEDAPTDQTIRQLLLAADQFIVKRNLPGSFPEEGLQEAATVIAGYHWFTDWGRDTMISLPGLCISTRKFKEARKILSAFANSMNMGMLPNRFQDNGEEPEYNTVDATLWFFIAVYKYFKATKDKHFVMQEMLPALKSVIEWHSKGTRFNIHEAPDGLLYSGESGVQLTWMDAKIGDWVVTPRIGKAVEVNALWYNALCIHSELLQCNNEYPSARAIQEKAILTKTSFNTKFWNKDTECLYDVISDDMKDGTIRPNQLLSISLPFPLVENLKAKSIVRIVSEKLYTPVGLRSLPADHPDYIGEYGGNAYKRDSAYHQGTVWSWLIGPYIDAIMKTNETDGWQLAREVIHRFSYHLSEACIGNVSEIFDGNAPHLPRGCIAQAWSVAELLRVICDYSLLQSRDGVQKSETRMITAALAD